MVLCSRKRTSVVAGMSVIVFCFVFLTVFAAESYVGKENCGG